MAPTGYLGFFQTEPQYANERGLTPEDWTAYFLTHLEQTNQVIDDWERRGELVWNLGACFSPFIEVPYAYWSRTSHQAGVSRGLPDNDSLAFNATRTKVKV